MTTQEELKIVLREIVSPAARAHGFSGSGTSWRRWNSLGDCAVIRVQSSDTSSSQLVRSTINIGLVPKPWLDWQQFRDRKPVNPRTVHESMGVWSGRLTTRLSYSDEYKSYSSWWHVWDRPSAVAAAIDMVGQLESVGFPALDRLHDRAQLTLMLQQVNSSDHEKRWADLHLAVMLSESVGVDKNLEEVLQRIEAADQGPKAEMVLNLVNWVKTRSVPASP